MTSTFQMLPENGTLLLEGDVPAPTGTYDFTVPRAGTLRPSVYYGTLSDYSAFPLTLTCNGAIVFDRFVVGGGTRNIDIPVDPSCSYRLTFWNWIFVTPTLRFGAVLLN